MRACASCGAQTTDTAKFCSSCGQAVPETIPAAAGQGAPSGVATPGTGRPVWTEPAQTAPPRPPATPEPPPVGPIMAIVGAVLSAAVHVLREGPVFSSFAPATRRVAEVLLPWTFLALIVAGAIAALIARERRSLGGMLVGSGVTWVLYSLSFLLFLVDVPSAPVAEQLGQIIAGVLVAAGGVITLGTTQSKAGEPASRGW